MLFQIGGLGIMVLSTFATILLGGRLGLRGEHALEEMLETKAPGHAYRLTRFIVLSTLAIEAVGALMLAVSFRVHDFAWAEAWWRAVFHSVSAFCNAGFALQSDSLVLFQEDPATLIVFTVLILAGGLGFVVLAWTWQRLTRKTRERTGTQTKVVVAVSIALLALGFVEFIAVEWNRSLSDLSLGSKVANAWFQTVTTRTAGFNSVDFVQIHPATVLTFIALMFIGASPGGTGGGIKTTTFAVLVAAVRTVARGEGKPTLFRRVIPDAVVLRASTITVVALILATACTFVLLLSQDSEFSVLAFEAVSALGTVGLSLGATGELGAGGKIAVIITMFAGRIGPLSLALVLARGRGRHFSYPTARIMVG
jgi:trk system potassium uptake protein TrkH